MCQKDKRKTILEKIAFVKGRNCYLFVPIDPNEKKIFKNSIQCNPRQSNNTICIMPIQVLTIPET